MTWFDSFLAHDLVIGVLVAVIVGAGTALVAAMASIRRAGRTSLDAGRPGDPVPPLPRPWRVPRPGRRLGI